MMATKNMDTGYIATMGALSVQNIYRRKNQFHLDRLASIRTTLPFVVNNFFLYHLLLRKASPTTLRLTPETIISL
jgi:hypothetical protein